MTDREHLTKLDNGCTVCKVKLCNMCPVGKKKDELRKKLGIVKSDFWSKLKKIRWS